MRTILNAKHSVKCFNCDNKIWSRKGDQELCYGCSPADQIDNRLTYERCTECGLEYKYNRYDAAAAILARTYSQLMDNCPVCYKREKENKANAPKNALSKWEKLTRIFVRTKS